MSIRMNEVHLVEITTSSALAVLQAIRQAGSIVRRRQGKEVAATNRGAGSAEQTQSTGRAQSQVSAVGIVQAFSLSSLLIVRAEESKVNTTETKRRQAEIIVGDLHDGMYRKYLYDPRA